MWERVTVGRLVSLSLYAFANSFLWNSLHPLVLPVLLLALVSEELKSTALGVLTFAGLVLALLLQPLTGSWSDRTRSRWGRRRPFVVVGALFLALLLPLLGQAPTFGLLFLVYLALQGAGNLAQGPYQGLLPDLVLASHRGAAAGAKNFAEILGVILAALLIGRALLAEERVFGALVLIAGVVTGAALLTAGLIREPQDAPPAAPLPPWRVFVFSVRRHADFVWFLVSRLFFVVAITSIQTFTLFYIRDVIPVDDPVKAASDLITVIGITILLVAYPAGIAADRWGRRPFLVFAALLGSLGAALLLAAQSYTEVILYGSLVGIGTGIFLTVNWALATELIPPNEAARFLGLTNIATAGGAALARLHGPLIDLFNRQGEDLGYRVLLALIALWFLTSAVLILRVRSRGPSALPVAQ
jgi:MFS family permease